MLRHTFEAHSNIPGFNFTCGVDGCPQTFRTYSAVRSHLHRKHRGLDCSYPHIILPIQDDATSNPVNVETCDVYSDSPALVERHLEVNRLERCAALFLLSLKERYQITQTALDFAVGQVQQMVTFAVEDIQNAVETCLSSYYSESLSEMPNITDCFKMQDPFRNLQNEYMQTKYYRENFDLIVSCR